MRPAADGKTLPSSALAVRATVDCGLDVPSPYSSRQASRRLSCLGGAVLRTTASSPRVSFAASQSNLAVSTRGLPGSTCPPFVSRLPRESPRRTGELAVGSSFQHVRVVPARSEPGRLRARNRVRLPKSTRYRFRRRRSRPGPLALKATTAPPTSPTTADAPAPTRWKVLRNVSSTSCSPGRP